MNYLRSVGLVVLAFLIPFAGSGCINPLSMGWMPPIPVPPWVTERIEERYCYDQDFKTPILPPIPPGHRPLCEDPPDLMKVVRAMPRVARGIPYIYEEFRDDLDYTVEKLADHIDPPRFYPLIGPAQLHHCHWKCNVFYTETLQSSYPFPYRCRRRRSEVIYIDTDHLHLVAPTPEAAISMSRDMVGPIP